jgi:hypothetical protein
VQLSDIVTVVDAIGGGAVLALFPSKSVLFGPAASACSSDSSATLLVLVVLVTISGNFGVDFFLDGRRKALAKDEEHPGALGSRRRWKAGTAETVRSGGVAA